MGTVRPRIAINLCSFRPGQLSGPSVYAERLTERLLDEEEIEWVIYCHRDYELPDRWRRRARIARVMGTIKRPLRVAFEQLVLPRICLRDRIDLLFSPNFVSPCWGARHLVATIHDMYYEVVPEVLPPLQRQYWRAFVPLTAYVCDRLLAVSRSTAEDIAHFLPRAATKVRVTPLANGVEPLAAETPVNGLEPGYVLWVANVVGSKNHTAIVEAAEHLADRQEGRTFIHVGTDIHGLLEAALRTSPASAHFRRLGRVSAGELQWLYRNALCVVQPSLYEGFGMPVLEAQAFGAPLLCSTAGPLPEIAGEGALFFSPRDSAQLARLVNRVATEAGLRDILRTAGRANVARFSWEKTAAATLAVFMELLFGTERAHATRQIDPR